MTDVNGNPATANLTLYKSTVVLTIDAIDDAELNKKFLSQVTGTIDAGGDPAWANAAIWVNGVRATYTSSNTWRAVSVPVPEGGTGVIQARAIPLSENGGNGNGDGGGGTTSSQQNPGNPTATQKADGEAAIEKPPMIYGESYRDSWSHHLYYPSPVPRDNRVSGPFCSSA